ncbi:MAG TPA: NifU family protein [Gemmatimonadaceae bacterium]|nr:NifU family protein [Gemmatimonadaceae bacterium]
MRGSSRVAEKRRAEVEAQIREAIVGLQPLLRFEHCGVELVEFSLETGVATLRVEGGCPDCEMSAGMLLHGIEQHLRMRVPALRSIRSVDAHTGTHG